MCNIKCCLIFLRFAFIPVLLMMINLFMYPDPQINYDNENDYNNIFNSNFNHNTYYNHKN